jgi:hypothetical protein
MVIPSPDYDPGHLLERRITGGRQQRLLPSLCLQLSLKKKL